MKSNVLSRELRTKTGSRGKKCVCRESCTLSWLDRCYIMVYHQYYPLGVATWREGRSMAGSADSEASRAVVVVPRFEPRVNGYILRRT
jgi:hypothetical protein